MHFKIGKYNLTSVKDLGHLSTRISNSTSTHLTAFLLTGVPGLEDFQIWISIPFSFMYLLAVIGNGLVMAVVVGDRNLHEPMYLFLAMLALNDVLLCTVTVPQMLLIFWKGPSPLTFPACLTQMFFVHALFLSESAVLLAMAFDRYVAICTPLHYATFLTGSLISKVGLALVTRSVAVVTPGVLLILRLRFCRENIIHHTYCENMGIAKLACNSIALNSIYGLTAALLTTGLDFCLISLSYWLILRTVFQLPSREARTKAFATCGAHICVILIFYTLAFFSFFTHRFGDHVPKHVLILLANLYLLVPPTMNPIVYGVKTKEIRMHGKKEANRELLQYHQGISQHNEFTDEATLVQKEISHLLNLKIEQALEPDNFIYTDKPQSREAGIGGGNKPGRLRKIAGP
ncbi:olfactory receptor 52Z1-like [Puma concolor]|uniref:Olfactory receptor 52Z1-like n=1 Tax=Puma concolor TaxID=9696 RepID=A0A6P6IA56_PUMCO|nr:olfactory receptor 52Z1-like [Puma concolor]